MRALYNFILRLRALPRGQGRLLSFSAGGPACIRARKAGSFSQPVFRSQVLHLAGRSASSRRGRLAPFFLAAAGALALLIFADAISRSQTPFRYDDSQKCSNTIGAGSGSHRQAFLYQIGSRETRFAGPLRICFGHPRPASGPENRRCKPSAGSHQPGLSARPDERLEPSPTAAPGGRLLGHMDATRTGPRRSGRLASQDSSRVEPRVRSETLIPFHAEVSA